MENKNPQILIINGSARIKKNCSEISQLISSELSKNNITNKIFNIYDMNIDYCNACGFCDKTGYCRINDDMTPMYKMFDDAEGCIVVSPIHFDCISAKLKTVVDRTQSIYASKYILKKPSINRNKKRIGMYIAVGGSDTYETQFKAGQLVMDFFFKSINTKLLYNLDLNNTDKISFNQNEEFKNNLKQQIELYIKDVDNIK